MIRPRASWLLLKIGRRAAGVRASAIVHRFGLAAAGAALTLVVWILIVAAATYGARDERAAAREGVPASSAADTAAYWVPSADVLDRRQFSVIYLAPARLNTDPPPGLTRWPDPGEAFVSPELLQVARPTQIDRFGTLAGSIDRSGLLYPSEWLVYIGTDATTFTSRPDSAIKGFGVRGVRQSTSGLDALNYEFVGDFLPLALPLLGLPTALLCVVAARTGAEERDRRLTVLHAFGAGRDALARIVVGEAAAPIGIGISVGAGIGLLSSFVDIRLPSTDYIVAAADARSVVWTIPVVAIGCAVSMVALTVGLHRRTGPSSGPRPRRSEQAKVWPKVIFPAGVVMLLAGSVARGFVSTLLLVGGLSLMAAAMPALLGGQARRVGAGIARIGLRRNNAAALVGGRWLAARPQTLSRLVGAFVVGVLLTSVVQVAVSRTPDEVRAARSAQRAEGDRVVVVRSSLLPRKDFTTFSTVVGAAGVLYLREGAAGQELSASCETIATLAPGAGCPTAPVPLRALTVHGAGGPLSALVSAAGAETPISSAVPPSGDTLDTVLVLNLAGPGGLERIRATAYRTLPFPSVSLPTDSWLVGWSSLDTLLQWPLDIQAPGAALLVLAALLAVAATYVSHIRTLGSLSTYSTRRRFFVGVALWNLALPLAIATLATCIVASGVTELLRWMYGSERSATGFIFTLGCAVTVVGVFFAIACGFIGAAAARQWRPVAD